jgi:hypothetical protein
MQMANKQYGSPEEYEDKLKRVMERFGVDEYDFDWNRKGNCWIRFTIDGDPFYFSNSVDHARERGIKLRYGSDAFAQLVLTLEDLARANERGTFHLKKVLGAMIAIEPPKDIPVCFRYFGFDRIPSAEEAQRRYRLMAKQLHPDNPEHKGNQVEAELNFLEFQRMNEALVKYFDGKEQNG